MSNKQIRSIGLVKNWNPRGFFFIEQAAEGHQYFAHISDWVESDDDPHPAERVSFVIGAGRDGRPCAKSIMRAAV